MRKLFFIALLAIFFESLEFAHAKTNNAVQNTKNSCTHYKTKLQKCNSLHNQHEKQMCRLNLFAACK